MRPLHILLLTNRDSDNVGDQIIEATVISIVKGVMDNLDFSAEDFTISSRAAGIISKNYLKTRDPELLESARAAISQADLVIFGGAPLFNYSYQNFYLRTIITLELAQEYGVPVLFSSIGVEKFDGDNKKSRALKEALELPVVRQITTRDDIESLRLYAADTEIRVSHVADPAVLADIVYRKKPEPVVTLAFRTRVRRKLGRIARRLLRIMPRQEEISKVAASPSTGGAGAVAGQKRIGLVVTRAGIFADNGIEFNEADQRKFWLETIEELTTRGYDYRLFTTGHFSDEIFLDNLVKTSAIPPQKARVTVNSPDELIQELRGCDGVIAYRLHASITCFALDVPSIGLSWNFKVPYFYDSIGYAERAIDHTRWSADQVVPALETAMDEGIEKNRDFLTSVYDTLFTGIKDIVKPESSASPYSLDQLPSKLPRQLATGPKGYREKVNRKLRRTYENYQKVSIKAQTQK